MNDGLDRGGEMENINVVKKLGGRKHAGQERGKERGAN